MELPRDGDLSASAFSLLVLPITYNFHPIKIVDGILGKYETNVKLNYDDINYIVNICLHSTHSIFDNGDIVTSYVDMDMETPEHGEPSYTSPSPKITHYAAAIEWLEGAEM